MAYGFFAITLIWSLSMSLGRLAQLIFLEFATTIFQNVSTAEMIQSMWMGFRFDLLIIGFIWLPVMGLTSLLKLASLRFSEAEPWRYHVVAVKYYFPWVWFAICLLMLKDSFQFLMAGSRVRAAEHIPQLLNILGMLNQASVLLYSVLVFLLIWAVGHFSTRAVLSRIEWVNAKLPLLLGLLLLSGLMARGNLEPRHLAQEHCEIGHQSIVRELCLNAVWTMNKYQ